MNYSGFYRRFGKRFLDLAISLPAALVIALPVGIVAILVAWFLGRPILFRQKRAGLHGDIFMLNKFRTMRDDRNEQGELLPDEQRLTQFGSLLRRLSIDELPQLWNVIRGDMSLIGPRPLLTQYLDRYTPEQARRHEVSPGVTGWAQINGRNAISWDEKFQLDVWYVDHISFWLDIKILFLTAMKLFARSDINAKGHVTMPEFMGEQKP